MIVRMKKLTLLCTRASREATLNALRDYGVVHLTPIQPPEGNDLEKAREDFSYIAGALNELPPAARAKQTGTPAREAVDEIWKLIRRRETLEEQIETLRQKIRRYEPFGDFSPAAIQQLNAAGVTVKLVKLPVKNPPAFADGVQIVELSREKNTVYAALIYRGEIDFTGEEIPLPDAPLNEIKQLLSTTEKELSEIEPAIEKFAGDRSAIKELSADAENRIRYLEARDGMGSEKDILYLQGFFPVEKEDTIRATAGENGWAVLIETPSADDAVPTLLRNPKWMDPIKPVFKLIDVFPGYDEVDISGVFLIFLSIFYAFIVGDAGYGLLFIAASLFAKFKFRASRIAQMTTNLLILMSACTVVWGVINGAWFGISYDFLPAVLQNLTVPWLIAGGDGDLSRTRIMLICFTIGAIHLSIAHAWNIIRKYNSPDALCNFGWLFTTWSFYFLALNLVLNIGKLSIFMLAALGIGVLLITIGIILNRNFSSLLTLVLDVVGNFTDIISYVRLYAVGAASLAIAESFNAMGVDVNSAMPPVIGHLLGAIIIFAGHALNVVLAALSVLVHGVRLNTLEFSNHAGVQWGGTAYKPFRKN